MFIDVLTSFLRGIDLVSELSGLWLGGPVHVRAHELNVLVVRFSTGVKDFDPLADTLEDFAVERRVADCQSGCVEPMLFIFGKASIRRTATARENDQAESQQQDYQCGV